MGGRRKTPVALADECEAPALALALSFDGRSDARFGAPGSVLGATGTAIRWKFDRRGARGARRPVEEVLVLQDCRLATRAKRQP